jgi:hypothetical protein
LRLWSLHPQYLDTKGLLALWREGLLAQKVLQGRTKGYRNHPQLHRFKTHPFPLKAIGLYLLVVWEEANSRDYFFNKKKIKNITGKISAISITKGQAQYEWKHLREKIRLRDPEKLKTFSKTRLPKLHPSFRKVTGPVAPWEKF